MNIEREIGRFLRKELRSSLRVWLKNLPASGEMMPFMGFLASDVCRVFSQQAILRENHFWSKREILELYKESENCRFIPRGMPEAVTDLIVAEMIEKGILVDKGGRLLKGEIGKGKKFRVGNREEAGLL